MRHVGLGAYKKNWRSSVIDYVFGVMQAERQTNILITILHKHC